MKTLIIKLLIKLIFVNAVAVIGDVILFAISGDNITQIITALFSLTGLIITLKIKNKVEKVDVKVDSYKEQVDGMKTELVAAVKGKGEAEGNLQGRIEQAQEIKDAVAAPAITELKVEKVIVTSDETAVKATNVTVTKEQKEKNDLNK